MARAKPSSPGVADAEPVEVPEQPVAPEDEALQPSREEELAFLRAQMEEMRKDLAEAVEEARAAKKIPQAKMEPVEPALEPGTKYTMASGNVRENF